MKVTIRLHRQHDMDLFSIYRTKSYHIGREMKRCLIAYAKMEPYTPPEFNMDDIVEGYIPTSRIIHIELNPKKVDEAAAIELLNHIRRGYRCSFIKALFRSSLSYLPLLAYSDDSGFVTKRANTVMDINHIQTQAVINNMTQSLVTNKKSNDKTKTTIWDQSDVDTNTFKTESVPTHVSKPVTSDESAKQLIVTNNDTNDDTNNSLTDFDAMFAAMDNLGH